MKFKLLILAAICSLFIVSGCQKAENDLSEICCYLKNIDDNQVTVDIVEYVSSENTKQIEELGLDEGDMPQGFYINNPETELTTYTLTDDTEYCFFDWNFQFSDNPEERNVLTDDIEIFKEYLTSYSDYGAELPFFFEIQDGKVLKITEKIVM